MKLRYNADCEGECEMNHEIMNDEMNDDMILVGGESANHK